MMDFKEKSKKLINEVDQKNKEITVKTISFPFGHLSALYEKGNLIIQPKFQRFFRWSKNQKTNFIESILLGLPIPPIFVSKKGSNRELVDGLQRLSTMFEFFGTLKNADIPKNKSISKGLNGTEYMPSLEGFTFKDLPDNLKFELEWNYKIDVVILEDASINKDAKYELFYRLNTGGSSLSNQEIRSAIMIMEDENFYNEFDRLRNSNDFINSIFISDKDSEKQLDLELVLRFFSVKNYDINDGKIISAKSFLDKNVSKFIKKFDMENEIKVFKSIFNFISSNFEISPFRKYYIEEGKFKGRMNISAYDIITGGLGYALEHKMIDFKKDKEFIKQKIEDLSSISEFIKKTDVGITSEGKLNFSIKFGRDYFKK